MARQSTKQSKQAGQAVRAPDKAQGKAPGKAPGKTLDKTRQAIAAQAARLMAEDGIAEFGAAKRKAARQLGVPDAAALPSNAEIETELRTYQGLFQNDEQRARLAAMREIALDIMTSMSAYAPCLTGPVWNGTAGSTSAIVINLFAESPKLVEVWLLDAEVPYRVLEWPHFNRALERKVPVLSFQHAGYAIQLAVYSEDDRRGALLPDAGGTPARGDIAAVNKLLHDAELTESASPFLAAIR